MDYAFPYGGYGPECVVQLFEDRLCTFVTDLWLNSKPQWKLIVQLKSAVRNIKNDNQMAIFIKHNHQAVSSVLSIRL